MGDTLAHRARDPVAMLCRHPLRAGASLLLLRGVFLSSAWRGLFLATRVALLLYGGLTLLFVQIQLMCGAVRIILLSVNASRDDLDPK